VNYFSFVGVGRFRKAVFVRGVFVLIWLFWIFVGEFFNWGGRLKNSKRRGSNSKKNGGARIMWCYLILAWVFWDFLLELLVFVFLWGILL
jgi:hypothetical protein